MSKILDTQIISYALKGNYEESIQGNKISAITANEFLEVQGDTPTKANYYPPLLSQRHCFSLRQVTKSLIRDHPFHKITTDQILMDFGTDFPSVIEFGSLAISNLINNKNLRLFNEAIRHQHKDKIKLLRKRFAFLVDQNIQCVPLSSEMVSTGASLLSSFVAEHNVKKNFRNTLNDILIFSSAITLSSTLITEDKELNKFVIKHCGAKFIQDREHVKISFDNSCSPEQKKCFESKGYINKGWKIRFNKKCIIPS